MSRNRARMCLISIGKLYKRRPGTVICEELRNAWILHRGIDEEMLYQLLRKRGLLYLARD